MKKTYIPNVCLLVDENEGVVKEAARIWNERSKKETFRVIPECDPDDFIVEVYFVDQLPGTCTEGRLGCTWTRLRNGKVVYKGVYILADAPTWALDRHPLWTLVHELGHVAGCEDKDLDPPCR